MKNKEEKLNEKTSYDKNTKTKEGLSPSAYPILQTVDENKRTQAKKEKKSFVHIKKTMLGQFLELQTIKFRKTK